jgi:hypothetical protein
MFGVCKMQVFFSQVGEAALPLICNYKICKRGRKNLMLIWGKLHDFKEFFIGEAPVLL